MISINPRLSELLLKWHESENKREMPWKEEKDPYKIWLSEVILQQTQVAQGLSYYEKFTTKYPSVIDLANAKEEHVLADWAGLGYNSRAKNLHKAAKVVANEFSGDFPNTKSGLLELPGVGDYIASAVASFAFGEQTPVLDANVYRVLARWYLIEEEIQTPKAHKYFSTLLTPQLGQFSAAKFNQAIMDFGATVCKPKQPNCMFCPLQNECNAASPELAIQYPKKKQKAKRKPLFLITTFKEKEGKLALMKRPETGVWANMYSLPYLEYENKETFTEQHKIEPLITRKQLLSHKEVHIFVYPNELVDLTEQPIEWVNVKDVKKMPIQPIMLDIIKNFIKLV